MCVFSFLWETHRKATERHLPCGITQWNRLCRLLAITPARHAGIDVPTPKGWRAELTLVLVIYRDGLRVRRQSPVQVVATSWVGNEPRLFDFMSSVQTVKTFIHGALSKTGLYQVACGRYFSKFCCRLRHPYRCFVVEVLFIVSAGKCWWLRHYTAGRCSVQHQQSLI